MSGIRRAGSSPASGTKETKHGDCGHHGVEMPIVATVYRVCHEDLPVSDAIAVLMGRPLKCEQRKKEEKRE